ncbi:MAG TPA: hypothetical protein VIY48_15540 [Candidatus Paceibacterota bacterium]
MLEVDGTMLSTAIVSITTAVGGFMGGRVTGRTGASQIATETIEMLQAQVDLLREAKERNELEILDLVNRTAVLEGLVTQRADVQELSAKVSIVKGTVEKIALKVGA